MTKTIYLVDPETRVYVGPAPHPLDPVESERTGKPVYAALNPALATEVAPPRIPAGKRAVLVDLSWVLEDMPAAPAPVPAPPPVAPAPPPTPPRELTFEERLAALRGLVQDYMDAMAHAWGYDDIKTAVTYAEEPAVAKFQAEGRALRAWRSLVWASCYELLARVQAGETEEPTAESLPGLLPRLVPPEAEVAPKTAAPADDGQTEAAH
ncbi:hypothetical protein [Variovorax sp. YR216]|uniref:hypothetical protein n=1 Tax=Variovorax sp. YR216 TaxID=1882828 RepID=UPI000897030C|nr:hypothetical protein [Variovorax sp. YR216]SEA50443.1 hypothetical protein SAMN05444680_102681 [Variovorax sp. YR216]